MTDGALVCLFFSKLFNAGDAIESTALRAHHDLAINQVVADFALSIWKTLRVFRFVSAIFYFDHPFVYRSNLNFNS
jgi:hypothetical protein